MKNTTPKTFHLNTESNPENASLLVSGELYHTGCSLFGTEVTLYEYDMVSQKFICCLNGFFYFKLDYNKEYKIVVSKNGFETKIIVFNTCLHGCSVKKRYYDFGVSLNPTTANTEYKSDALPNAIVSYIPKKEVFEHDVEYIKQLQSNYKKVA